MSYKVDYCTHLLCFEILQVESPDFGGLVNAASLSFWNCEVILAHCSMGRESDDGDEGSAAHLSSIEVGGADELFGKTFNFLVLGPKTGDIVKKRYTRQDRFVFGDVFLKLMVVSDVQCDDLVLGGGFVSADVK